MILKKLPLLLIPVFGIWLILYATEPYKLGIAPDSISYLSIAHHLAAGKGVEVYIKKLHGASSPTADWPPVYPFLLSFFVLGKVRDMTGTWVLNSLLFGLNILLAEYILYK